MHSGWAMPIRRLRRHSRRPVWMLQVTGRWICDWNPRLDHWLNFLVIGLLSDFDMAKNKAEAVFSIGQAFCLPPSCPSLNPVNPDPDNYCKHQITSTNSQLTHHVQLRMTKTKSSFGHWFFEFRIYLPAGRLVWDLGFVISELSKNLNGQIHW